jgi:hypothetical protein
MNDGVPVRDYSGWMGEDPLLVRAKAAVREARELGERTRGNLADAEKELDRCERLLRDAQAAGDQSHVDRAVRWRGLSLSQIPAAGSRAGYWRPR